MHIPLLDLKAQYATIRDEIKPAVDEIEGFNWFTYSKAKKLNFAFGYKRLIDGLFKLKLINLTVN